MTTDFNNSNSFCIVCTVINFNNSKTTTAVVKCVMTVDCMVQPCEEGPNVPWYYIICTVCAFFILGYISHYSE